MEQLITILMCFISSVNFVDIPSLQSLLIKSDVKISWDRQKIILGFGAISQMEALTPVHLSSSCWQRK